MRKMSLRVRPLQLSSNRLPPLTCRRTKCFPPSSTTCAVLLSLSHSGLISFDGKMNVIISLPQKKISLFRCPFPAENRNSPFVLHMPPPPLYFEWNCGVASHPARRHGIAVLNLFVCAGATHGVVAAKGCERPCSPRSAPARARPPAVRQSSRRLMLQDTRSLCG